MEAFPDARAEVNQVARNESTDFDAVLAEPAIDRLEDQVDRGLDLHLAARCGVAQRSERRRQDEATFDGDVLDGSPADDEVLDEGGVRRSVHGGERARVPLAHVRVVELDEEAQLLVGGAGRLEAGAAEEEVAVERPLDGSFESALVARLEEHVDVEVQIVATSRNLHRRGGTGEEQGRKTQRDGNAIHGFPFAADRARGVGEQASEHCDASTPRPAVLATRLRENFVTRQVVPSLRTMTTALHRRAYSHLRKRNQILGGEAGRGSP